MYGVIMKFDVSSTLGTCHFLIIFEVVDTLVKQGGKMYL